MSKELHDKGGGRRQSILVRENFAASAKALGLEEGVAIGGKSLESLE